MWGRSRNALAPLVCLGLVAMGLPVASASAQTTSFTTPGCQAWEVPTGVSSVTAAAVGQAGEKGHGSELGTNEGGSGGKGDAVSVTLAVAPKAHFDVCVDSGGGEGGSAAEPPVAAGGNGGGAAGVSLGEDFSHVLLVAGGGGGGGGCCLIFSAAGSGGAAGQPGSSGAGVGNGGAVGGGGGSTAAGPGRGQSGGPGEFSGGGGGGGGYVGGGGGEGSSETLQEEELGAAGGAGGTDFCAAELTCSIEREAGTGAGSVVLTYSIPPPCTTVVGRGVYKKSGEAGRLKLENNLSTNVEVPQKLHVRFESGRVHFRLTKLQKASCSGSPGERDFHGEGGAASGGEAGYSLSFSIYEKGEGRFFFESTLTKGGKAVEVSGGPLARSTEKIA